jgi:hypothetical protein
MFNHPSNPKSRKNVTSFYWKVFLIPVLKTSNGLDSRIERSKFTILVGLIELKCNFFNLKQFKLKQSFIFFVRFLFIFSRFVSVSSGWIW